MQAAVPVGEGAMAACLGLSLEDAQAVALEAAGDILRNLRRRNVDGETLPGRTGYERQNQADSCEEFRTVSPSRSP